MGLPSPRVGHGYRSQQYLSRSVADDKQPFLSSTGKFSMMHFNRTEAGMWASIVFTSPYHDICYLSFHLKLQGTNFVADNFKFLKIIVDTDMIIRKFKKVFACPKESLNRCKHILQLALKDSLENFHGLSLQMIFQVQNQIVNYLQTNFTK